MKFFSLIIIFFMNMENFKCQENKDCVGFATYTCAPHLYGGDSYEYSWCDNRGKCGCAVKCNKGPNKGDTCIGTCENVCCIGGLLAQSICLGINTEWNVKCDEKAGSTNSASSTSSTSSTKSTSSTSSTSGCAIAVSSLWLCFSAFLIIPVNV